MENSKISYCFFDSHAHYYDSRFYGEENPEGADALLRELFENGLLGVVNIGTNIETSKKVIEQAAGFEKMYAAVGLHPEDISVIPAAPDQQLKGIYDLIDTKEKRAKNKIVALGEIGLDYYWQPVDKEMQMFAFEEQMKMAQELCIPVIIHDREAHGDCFDMVMKYPDVKGVFHSYSGSAEMAKELVRRGWYISLSGVVSFKNAPKVKEVAREIPLDRLLIETDAPYLAPTPFRGKLNHSGRLFYTASAIADERGTTVEEISKATYENAKSFFKL